MAARARREARAGQGDVRIEWFIKEVSNKVRMSMKQRVRIASELLRSKVTKNISTPVVKEKGARGVTIVTERSEKGEFPRADTTQLMKTIFHTVVETSKGVFDGYVGTPLDYGLILEVSERLDRSFLLRTFNQERGRVDRILRGPIR
jgi:hypothetical protein